MNDPALLAGMLTVIVTLVKLLELAFNAVFKKVMPNSVITGSFSEEEKDVLLMQIRGLYDMHNKYDNDGTPIWYVPRSWDTTQKDILKTVSDVAHTQEKLADTMERCVSILDRIDRRNNAPQ